MLPLYVGIKPLQRRQVSLAVRALFGAFIVPALALHADAPVSLQLFSRSGNHFVTVVALPVQRFLLIKRALTNVLVDSATQLLTPKFFSIA
jgi:hypothetical protein